MDNWYSHAVYPMASPFLHQKNELPSIESFLHRDPGSQRQTSSSSSEASDASSKNRGSAKIKKNRRFLFVGKRKKNRDLASTPIQTAITTNNSGDVTADKVFKPITYSPHGRLACTPTL